jgi:hypothetical protein
MAANNARSVAESVADVEPTAPILRPPAPANATSPVRAGHHAPSMVRARRLIAAVAWLVVVVAISLGVAGLVSAMSPPPGTAGRPELTAAGDRASRPVLDAAESDLRSLSTDVDRLGELARGALAAMANSDASTLDGIIAEGSALATTINDRGDAVELRLAGVPATGSGVALRLSPGTQARRAALVTAAGATGGVGDAWTRLADGSLSAVRVSTALTDHDALAGEAAKAGRAGDYAGALEQLGRAEARLAEAGALRDRLRNTVDVGVLTAWIDRNTTYDAALRTLWQALMDSNGRLTPEVHAAIDAEAKARKLLPPDTRALVVILGEIGRGGLNQAVTAIEEARGRLETALADASDAVSTNAPGPGGSDSP